MHFALLSEKSGSSLLLLYSAVRSRSISAECTHTIFHHSDARAIRLQLLSDVQQRKKKTQRRKAEYQGFSDDSYFCGIETKERTCSSCFRTSFYCTTISAVTSTNLD